MSSKNKKINIVMFNMSSYSDWEKGIQNRNWHILRQLLVDERVAKILAVDYLPHTFKRALRVYKQDILNFTEHKVIYRSIFSRAVEVSDKLTVYSSVWPKISLNRFYEEINQLLKKIEISDYLVWSYYPLTAGYFDKLKGQLKVFDTVDNWAEHPSYEKFKGRLIDNYKIIDQKADVIFTVSEELHNLFSNQEKVYWISNGVDVKHYQKEYPILNRDIGEIPHPIIGYVGTIQDRLDQNLLEYLVKDNIDKSFVMVGPVWYKEIEKRFTRYQNIYFLGRKSYEEIPMYIQQFDVGIIPHKVDKFIKSTNPMKIYEYLACSKPIVSTQGSGIETFKDLVYITNDYQEFNQKIAEALKKDSQKLREKRLETVKEHSWLRRVEAMLDVVYKKT